MNFINNGKPNSNESLRRRRLGDLKRVLLHRYGRELPDDDAGRADLELLLDVVSLASDSRRRMKNIIETWAPWMETAESYGLVENILRKPEYLRKVKAADLGERLNLTYLERQKLAIRTIAPADLTPEEFLEKRKEQRRQKARDRQARRRRKAGGKSRTASLAHLKPWERLGISRRTWYRRRGTGGGTSSSHHKLLHSGVTNLCQSVGVERQREIEKEVGRVGRKPRVARA
jgi:hypothetical protein